MISRLTPEGNYVVEICRSLSEMKGGMNDCDKRVADFCFFVIQKYYNSGKYNLTEALKIEMLKIYNVNLIGDLESRLLMAQGALYVLMSNNFVLENGLRYEYDAKKGELDFVINWESSNNKVKLQ